MDRCVRHPSQFFTGFCSSCLVERLSHVDSPSSIPPHPEIVEAPSSSSSSSVLDSAKRGGEIRARTTLLSLFQLDDSSNIRADANLGDSEDRVSKDRHKNSSFRSNSVLPATKGFRWGSRCGSKSGRFADEELESKQDAAGHSSDWEKPRHSWDGSMVSKALACSFACLEEPLEGSRRVSRRAPEETVVSSSDRCSGTVDSIKVDEKPSSPNLRESHRVESISRKKSHRWSRVWDWSITSPFRDFGKRRERNLERSLSESWQNSRKEKIAVGLNGNGISSGRTNQSLSRNVNGSKGEIQKFRPEWQRKREYRFGRSRSIHYPSPGNVDNGLLRFYLTPMRSSIRSSNRGRIRSSRFFAKGILGR